LTSQACQDLERGAHPGAGVGRERGGLRGAEPAAPTEGGMRVRMESLWELVDAPETSRWEDDLLGLGPGSPES
jgi:hypothetical protein